MTKVIWSEEAFSDLDDIYNFLASQYPKSANSIIKSILSRTKQLETFPQSGSIIETLNQAKEYRYLVEGHYKIIYSNTPKGVFVETVFDTRQSPIVLET